MSHRFIDDGQSPPKPLLIGSEFVCTCGEAGSYAVVARHIAEMHAKTRGPPPADFEGDATEAHYVPMEPRIPAATAFGEADSITPFERPPPSPPSPPAVLVDAPCRTCGEGVLVADLPEITAWSCGHWTDKRPRSIAELFQDMLRSAFEAGVASAATGESFETWYQREVLQ